MARISSLTCSPLVQESNSLQWGPQNAGLYPHNSGSRTPLGY